MTLITVGKTCKSIVMKKWKVTIKEKMMDRPIETYYVGDVDREFVKKWFGCDQPDVEWYEIEEE